MLLGRWDSMFLFFLFKMPDETVLNQWRSLNWEAKSIYFHFQLNLADEFTVQIHRFQLPIFHYYPQSSIIFYSSTSRGKKGEKLGTQNPKNLGNMVVRMLRRSKNHTTPYNIAQYNRTFHVSSVHQLAVEPFNNTFLSQQLSQLVHTGNLSILGFIIKLVSYIIGMNFPFQMEFDLSCKFVFAFLSLHSKLNFQQINGGWDFSNCFLGA